MFVLILARHAHDDGMALRHHIFHMVGQRQWVCVVLVSIVGHSDAMIGCVERVRKHDILIVAFIECIGTTWLIALHY